MADPFDEDIYSDIGTPDIDAYDQVFHRNITYKNLSKDQNISRAMGMDPNLYGEVQRYTGGTLPPIPDRTMLAQHLEMVQLAHHQFYPDTPEDDLNAGLARGYNFSNLSDRPIEPYIGQTYKYSDTGEQVNLEPVHFGEQDTEFPTATKNPLRPRTVAAAFDAQRHIITIIFRDGTMYNYYECTQAMWNHFKTLRSKGEYIRTVLDGKPRGIADVSGVDPQIRLAAVTTARLQQYERSKGTSSFKKAKMPRGYPANRGKATPNNLYGGTGIY